MSRRRTRRPPAPRKPSASPPQPPPSRAVRADVIIALAITVVAGILLAMYFTHATALWRDEVSSVHTQQSPTLAEMWRRAEFESFPLLWMLLLRGWLSIGGGASDAALRVFGLIGPVALIAAIWFASLRLGRAAPLVSLALLVSNPELFRWSATLRPWGLGTGLAIATIPLMWDAARAPTTRRVVVAGIVALLSVHCLFQNAVFLAAIGVAAMAVGISRRRGGEAWRLAAVPVGIGIVAAASLLPYLGIIRRRGDWNALGAGEITLGDLVSTLSAVVAVPGTLAWLAWIVLIGAAVLLALVARRSQGSDTPDANRDLAIYASVVLVVSAIGVMLLYRQLKYPTQPWYYLGLVAVTSVCAEIVLRTVVPRRIIQPVLAIAATAVMTLGFSGTWGAMLERQTNIDVVAARLKMEAGANDLVIVNPWYLGVTLSRYYSGPAEVMTIPPIADRTISRYDLLKQQMLTPDAAAPLRTRIQEALSRGHRVWLVGGFFQPSPGAPAKLPLPPLAETGWNSVPYELLWSTQVAAWLSDHAARVRALDLGADGHRLENAGLFVFEGWK